MISLKCECGGELKEADSLEKYWFVCQKCQKSILTPDIIARCAEAEARLAETDNELAEQKLKNAELELYNQFAKNEANKTYTDLTALRSRVDGVTEEKIERIIEKNSLWQHEHRYYEVKDTQKKAIAKAILTLLNGR